VGVVWCDEAAGGGVGDGRERGGRCGGVLGGSAVGGRSCVAGGGTLTPNTRLLQQLAISG
ncbi:hypothetical protein BXO34_17895, partial [Xanthomonas oryzae pv. oryzae]